MLEALKEIQEAVALGQVSQTELANRSGLGVSTINAIILNPEPNPRVRTAEPLVRAYRELLAERQAAAQAEAAREVPARV